MQGITLHRIELYSISGACTCAQVTCYLCAQTEQRAGETIYKGHRSYDLMLNLQLGIRNSVSCVANEPLCPTLEPAHFSAKVGQSKAARL